MNIGIILVARGVQDQEYWYPYYRMQEAGFQVVTLSPDGLDTVGKYGIPIKVDGKIGEFAVSALQTKILIVPGGWECPEKLRMCQPALDLVKIVRSNPLKNKIVLGAICHGPQVLISADVIEGYQIAGYAGIKDDINNAGATYNSSDTVRDRNIVTAPHYKNNPTFMKEILSGL